MKTLRQLFILAAVLTVFAPLSLFACATCSGHSSSAMAVGMNWGIFTLLGVLVPVLLSFLFFFIYLIRKSETLNAAAEQAAKKVEPVKIRPENAVLLHAEPAKL